MSNVANELYEFGPFQLDPRERLLLRDGDPLPLTPKAFETLLVLIRNSGHLMLKDELMKAVWPDSFVEEVNLSQNISILRRALSDTAQGSRYIVTVPGKGYRFVGQLRQPEPDTEIKETLVLESHSRTRITVEETRFKFSLLSALTITVCVLAAAALWATLHGKPTFPTFKRIQLSKLTHDGNTRLSAVSPDGRYVAYLRRDKQASVWVDQIATDSTFQLIPPQSVYYDSLTFSPDGNYLYFARARGNQPDHYDLYVVPSLGGVERRVLLDVESPLGFSPDNKQLAFLRRTTDRHRLQIVVADRSDFSERVLTTFDPGEAFEGTPAWSPDGKLIAVAARSNDSGRLGAIDFFTPDGQKTKTLLSDRIVTNVAWIPDGSGLVETAYENGRFFNHQIWFQPYPKGSPRRVTNDSSSYVGLSLSSDGKVLTANEQVLSSSVFVGPASAPANLAAISTGKNDSLFLDWLDSGNLLLENGMFHFSIAHADGSQLRPLALREDVLNAEPAMCGNGASVVMTSLHQGHWNIFKLDPASQQLTQLSSGTVDDHPYCSSDGHSIIYDSETSQGPRLLRISADSSTPERLVEANAVAPRFSPDNKLIAFWLLDKNGASLQPQLAVMKSDAATPFQTFDLPPNGIVGNQALMRWTPDGKSITYVLRQPDGSHFWSQPLVGGQPKHVAHFDDLVFWYSFSPDGKQIAMTRGQYLRDVILLNNLQ